jgi:pantoate--beta-alanine ligase
MQIHSDPREMQIRAEDVRRDGRKIGLVPTMGYLHAGHIVLLEEARRRCDVPIVSIFVNPMQFGPNEDLAQYPRDLEGDLAKAREAGCDYAFVPEIKAMYPAGFQTSVQVKELSQGLCGDRRPGHFEGVATAVLKLIHIVKPHLAIFGEKDYQQLAVLRRMVRDLDLDVEIVGVPIVREPDGLAMSSRNAYLSPAERREALVLSRALARAEELWKGGERHAGKLVDAARAVIGSASAARIDYVEIRDPETLAPLETIRGPALIALAVFIGKTRLIDNRVLPAS